MTYIKVEKASFKKWWQKALGMEVKSEDLKELPLHTYTLDYFKPRKPSQEPWEIIFYYSLMRRIPIASKQ